MLQRFHYGRLMHKAMRSLMVEVLDHVAEHGLPGEHHFFISFDTTHPGVDIPDHLRERYPDAMTIVLQDWFEDLVVTKDRFSVRLNFGDVPETLVVPLMAVQTFVDPSAEFGLRFDGHDDDDPGRADLDDSAPPAPVEVKGGDEAPSTGDVVSLDQFRKH